MSRSRLYLLHSLEAAAPGGEACFGGFQPSNGHGTRVCKILRAEWLRQARMYRDALFLPLLHDQHVMHKKTRWREYTGRIDHVVDYLWQGELRRLRSQFSTTRRGSTGVVHTYGDIALPDFVMKTLGLGPKFAVEKRRTPTELLATVRQVANCAPPEDTDRCVSEGLDVLLRERSCHHVLEASLLAQSERLEREGYPRTLLVSVAEAMHRKRKRLGTVCNSDGTTAEKREKAILSLGLLTLSGVHAFLLLRVCEILAFQPPHGVL
ncbi:hypothetical protein HPB51_008412 [Rhipicephalus microplus]|uniref:Uncharacterized protein n=1 Tax=Rhipicephalus microplus TaxID=6941 RepID=A0A9J6DFK5_RHIMP|nr:hypothetical protein HPB51_008412 [Rhipicephalus microplus]